MYYMSDVYPVTVHDTCEQIDKLFMFLLHHFESEITDHESFLQIENRLWVPTDNATQNVASDIQRLSDAFNTMKKNVYDLDGQSNGETVPEITNLQNDVAELQGQNQLMEQQLQTAMSAIQELRSELNIKQKDNDK
jgi:capsule polysaccharide export protein KpsE/RkpR